MVFHRGYTILQQMCTSLIFPKLFHLRDSHITHSLLGDSLSILNQFTTAVICDEANSFSLVLPTVDEFDVVRCFKDGRGGEVLLLLERAAWRRESFLLGFCDVFLPKCLLVVHGVTLPFVDNS